MCGSPFDMKFESQQNRTTILFTLYFSTPHTFKNFRLSKILFPDILNEKSLGKKKSVLISKDSVTAAQRQLTGEWLKAAQQGWSPGTSPWGCSRARTSTCPPQFTQDLLRWGFYDHTFQNVFLSYNNHTLKQAEDFLSFHPTEVPTYWAPKIIFSPPLARYIFTKQCPGLPSEFWNTCGSTSILYNLLIIEEKYSWVEGHTVYVSIYNAVRNTYKTFNRLKTSCFWFYSSQFCN